MRKTVVLLITVSMLLTLFGCASKKPASTGETTTAPAVETTCENNLVDRSLFDSVVIGEEFDWKTFSKYEREEYLRAMVERFKCTDGGYIYVEFATSFFENGEIDSIVVKRISDEYTIPVHDRALFEQVTVGMSQRDLYTLLDGDEGTCVTSGRFVFEYLHSDGSRGYLTFGSAGEGYPENYNVVDAVYIKEPTNE